MEDYLLVMALTAATFTAINKLPYGKLSMVLMTVIICFVLRWR